MLVLSFCLGFSLVVGLGCYSVVAVCRPLSVCVVGGASLVAEHKLWGPRASVLWLKGSVVAVPRVLSTGSIAVAPRLNCSVARGIFLDQGLTVYPVLAGRFFTTEPPVKPMICVFLTQIGFPVQSPPTFSVS